MIVDFFDNYQKKSILMTTKFENLHQRIGFRKKNE